MIIAGLRFKVSSNSGDLFWRRKQWEIGNSERRDRQTDYQGATEANRGSTVAL